MNVGLLCDFYLVTLSAFHNNVKWHSLCHHDSPAKQDLI